MKAYKRYSAARKAANGEPIVAIGDLYVVGITKADGYLTEIKLIDGGGRICGNVTARHLDRLGNANHAKPGDVRDRGEYRIWPAPPVVNGCEYILQPQIGPARNVVRQEKKS